MASPATYLTWIALSPVCSFAVFAQGGPPLLTDDPGTPGNRNWEINIASTQFFSPRENEIETPLLDINYGLGDRIQLKYEVPVLVDRDEGELLAFLNWSQSDPIVVRNGWSKRLPVEP